MNNAFDEIVRALDFILGRKPMNTIDNYMRLAKKINEMNKKDKEAQDEFSKLFKNDENEL